MLERWSNQKTFFEKVVSRHIRQKHFLKINNAQCIDSEESDHE